MSLFQLKTQIQRETLLAKEAKYEQGLKKEYDYDELLSAFRENSNVSRGETRAGSIIFVLSNKKMLLLNRAVYGSA